jgi:acyl-CoA reductase-like NAD-dependent aldehyde dehydrogenase
MPHNHAKNLCTFSTSTPELVDEAIVHALAAKADWESMPYNDRAAIFLKVSLFLGVQTRTAADFGIAGMLSKTGTSGVSVETNTDLRFCSMCRLQT